MAHDVRNKVSVLEQLNGELMCGVCLELYDIPVLLPCGHNFCQKCIAGIINNGPEHMTFSFISVGPPNSFNCPLCQASINLRLHSLKDLPVNKTLESIVFLYQNHSPVDIFDHAWNTDMKGEIISCTEHKLPRDRYCDSCSVMVCSQCETEKHAGQKARHKIEGLMEKVTEQQSEIASLLTEVKKSDMQLNDRMQLLEDIISGIDNNEEHVTNQLDQHVNVIMAFIRQRREELKRCLTNDFTEIRSPITEELRKCKALKTTIQELMKKLSSIRRIRDIGLRIKLMKDSRKHLDKLLRYEIPWCVQNQEIPEVVMPRWELSTLATTRELAKLHWKHHIVEKNTKSEQREDPGKAKACEENATDQAGCMSLVTPGEGQEVKDNVHDPDDSCGDIQPRERTFDELDGDMPVASVKEATDNGHTPVVVVVTPEHVRPESSGTLPAEETSQSQSSETENQSNVNDDQAGACAMPEYLMPNHRENDRETSHSVGDKTDAQSMLSLNMTNSPVAEKFKKRGERNATYSGSPSKSLDNKTTKVKAKKISKDKISSSKKPSKEEAETSPRTTREALASFMARRRTMSPASSVGRSLDVFSNPDDATHDGREDRFRSSKSDTKLLALDTDMRSVPANMSGPDWNHSTRTRSFSPTRFLQTSAPVLAKCGEAPHLANTGAVVFNQSQDHHDASSELSPKIFSKQPISVTLDFSSGPSSQDEVRPKVEGQETQI